MSFRELRERVDALAAGLAGLGLVKGDRLCILAQNDLAYVELYGACARQGIVAYPINWRLTAQEVERVLERAAPAMMVVDATALAVAGAWPAEKRGIKHWYQLGASAAAGFTPLASLHKGAPRPARRRRRRPVRGDLDRGRRRDPRGAVLTHTNVITASLTAMACLGYTASDRYLLALPLFHITALGGWLAHCLAGGASVLVAKYDAEEAVRLIDRHQVTHVSDFPPVLITLLDAADKLGSRLPSLRYVSGSTHPPPSSGCTTARRRSSGRASASRRRAAS